MALRKVLSRMASTVTNGVRSRVIDLRSDTVTQPSAAMRKAMAEALVGDDVYKEDPTVNELETRCAQLFGMEAALFVPSGSMGNLISLLIHTSQIRGAEIIVGNQQHIYLFEQGSYAQFGGISASILPNLPDGTMDLDEIRAHIRKGHDAHETKTAVICLENTHNMCGGQILPMDFQKQVRAIADEHAVKVHLDGARIYSAAVASGRPVKELLQYADSTSMCLSKNLGCPVGSVIGGTKDFIKGAIRMRKALGGGMRQVGILAAAGLVALDNAHDVLSRDHNNAKRLADGITALQSSRVSLATKIHTNMVNVSISDGAAEKFSAFLRQPIAGMHSDNAQLNVYIRTDPRNAHRVRMVIHCDVSEEDVDTILKRIGQFCQLKSLDDIDVTSKGYGYQGF